MVGLMVAICENMVAAGAAIGNWVFEDFSL